MPYLPVKPPPRFRLSDAVSDQLERLMVDGSLRPGDALPSERDLAQQLNVSRPSLREALLRLEARQLIEARSGGGYLVANASAPLIAQPLAHLMARHGKAANDIFEIREGLETMAVELAAIRATQSDIQKLKGSLDALEQAYALSKAQPDAPGADSQPMDMPTLDAQFHMILAEATHNVVLCHVMRGIYNVIQSSIEESYHLFAQRDTDIAYLVEQHRTIYDAVRRHDATAARRALSGHLAFIRENAGR
jgi:GntR family transcriptional repressor for pyruvate dehydrogenase complex